MVALCLYTCVTVCPTVCHSICLTVMPSGPFVFHVCLYVSFSFCIVTVCQSMCLSSRLFTYVHCMYVFTCMLLSYHGRHFSPACHQSSASEVSPAVWLWLIKNSLSCAQISLASELLNRLRSYPPAQIPINPLSQSHRPCLTKRFSLCLCL